MTFFSNCQMDVVFKSKFLGKQILKVYAFHLYFHRMFDSQNNNRGGYNVGSLYYTAGSVLPIEW